MLYYAKKFWVLTVCKPNETNYLTLLLIVKHRETNLFPFQHVFIPFFTLAKTPK